MQRSSHGPRSAWLPCPSHLNTLVTGYVRGWPRVAPSAGPCMSGIAPLLTCCFAHKRSGQVTRRSPASHLPAHQHGVAEAPQRSMATHFLAAGSMYHHACVVTLTAHVARNCLPCTYPCVEVVSLCQGEAESLTSAVDVWLPWTCGFKSVCLQWLPLQRYTSGCLVLI